MLELLYCILLGWGALTAIATIIYAISLLFKPSKEETETDCLLDISNFVYAIARKHGDQSLLDGYRDVCDDKAEANTDEETT